MTKILIIDGDYLFHRHLNTNSRNLTTSDGKPSGIVYGALNSLYGMLEAFNPNIVFIALSGGSCEWRKNIYPMYKFKTEEDKKHWDIPKDGELLSSAKIYTPQFNYIKDNLKFFGVREISLQGYEADDCAMRLAIRYAQLPPDQCEVILVSDDWDYAQTVEYGVKLYRPIKDYIITTENFETITGFKPKHYKYYKTIQGDGSDNIPSVAKGLGEVTTKKMFKSIEENIGEVNLQTIKEFASNSTIAAVKRLSEDWPQYLINLQLSDPANIPTNHLDEYLNKVCSELVYFNSFEVSRVLRDYELKSLNKILTYPFFQKLV